jgi:hypothetical protein
LWLGFGFELQTWHPETKIVEISEEYHNREVGAEGDAIYDLQSIVIHK